MYTVSKCHRRAKPHNLSEFAQNIAVLPVLQVFAYIYIFYVTLKDTARYAGLLLTPAEGFGLWPRFFLGPLGTFTSFTSFLLHIFKSFM